MTNTGRLETFADGVFAIAITLLVLGIGLPQPNAALWNALLAEWPALVAYVVSFLTIGIMWINHHQLFTVIGRSNMTFAFINVVFLMIVAFIPYATEILAQRIASGVDATGATVLYGAVMVAIASMFNVIWGYASGGGGRLLRAGLDARAMRGGRGGSAAARLLALLSLLFFFSRPISSPVPFVSPVVGVLPRPGTADAEDGAMMDG